MKKSISILLVIALLCGIPAPVFATDYTNISTSGNTVVVNGYTHYFESTPEFTISIIISPEQIADYAILKSNSNVVLHGNTNYSRNFVSTANIIKTIRNELLTTSQSSNTLHLEAIPKTVITQSSEKTNNTRISSSHQTLIDAQLYSRHGSPYNKKFLASHSQNGYNAELYEQMQFLYASTDTIIIQAMTLVTVASVLVGIASAELIKILSSIGTIAGEMYVTSLTSVPTYTVTVLYTKSAYVDGTYVMPSGKQVIYKAAIGDKNASLTHKSTNASEEYLLSHIGLLQRAISKYHG